MKDAPAIKFLYTNFWSHPFYSNFSIKNLLVNSSAKITTLLDIYFHLIALQTIESRLIGPFVVILTKAYKWLNV